MTTGGKDYERKLQELMIVILAKKNELIEKYGANVTRLWERK